VGQVLVPGRNGDDDLIDRLCPGNRDQVLAHKTPAIGIQEMKGKGPAANTYSGHFINVCNCLSKLASHRVFGYKMQRKASKNTLNDP
jgi:hypothetical protein